MLSVLFEILGYPIEQAQFYVMLILLAAIVFTLIIFLTLKSKAPPKIKSREELYADFAKLGEEKARMKAKLAALEETKNYGRISQKDYEEQLSKTQNSINALNEQMDDVLRMLAIPHYGIKLQQEQAMETEKMSLLVKLQEDVNKSKAKIEELQGSLDDVGKRNEILDGENRELKQKLDNLESSYKDRVIKLEEQLDAARKGAPSKRNTQPMSAASDEDLKKYKEKIDEYYHKIQLYQLLVSRYKNHIETSETKTVPDVKSLVQPSNSNIVAIARKIKLENNEYLKQYQTAYDSVDGIHSVPYIGTTLWLSIKEMLDNKVADYEDKAILLCSILRALGANARVLVTLMTDGSNRPLVLINMKDKSILLDPNDKHDFIKYVGKRADLLKQFSVEDQKIKRTLYEFNDKDYISYEA